MKLLAFYFNVSQKWRCLYYIHGRPFACKIQWEQLLFMLKMVTHTQQVFEMHLQASFITASLEEQSAVLRSENLLQVYDRMN